MAYRGNGDGGYASLPRHSGRVGRGGPCECRNATVADTARTHGLGIACRSGVGLRAPLRAPPREVLGPVIDDGLRRRIAEQRACWQPTLRGELPDRKSIRQGPGVLTPPVDQR